MALQHGEARAGTVTAVTVGGWPPTAGCASPWRVASSRRCEGARPTTCPACRWRPSWSTVVGRGGRVWCGDYSADNGPAACRRSWPLGSMPQGLGLVDVEFGDPLRGTRRLDGGRREVLRLTPPRWCRWRVGGSPAPRLAASGAHRPESGGVAVRHRRRCRPATASVVAVRPYRPRARVLPCAGRGDGTRPASAR